MNRSQYLRLSELDICNTTRLLRGVSVKPPQFHNDAAGRQCLQRRGVLAHPHSAPVHRFYVHGPERLDSAVAHVRAHRMAAPSAFADPLFAPASVFRAHGADDAKLCRNPVEHFADALADRMKRRQSTRTLCGRYREQHPLAAGDRAAACGETAAPEEVSRHLACSPGCGRYRHRDLPARAPAGQHRAARSGGRTAPAAAF